MSTPKQTRRIPQCGGSWFGKSHCVRSAYINNDCNSDYVYFTVGFRVKLGRTL